MFLKGDNVINTVDKGGTVMIGSPIMKKSLVFGIICLFVGSAFISCASRFTEVIDQHQDNFYPGQGLSVNVNEYRQRTRSGSILQTLDDPLDKG